MLVHLHQRASKTRFTLVTIRTYRPIFIYFTRCTDTGVIVTHALLFYRPQAPLFMLTHAQLAVVTQSCALLYIAAHCDVIVLVTPIVLLLYISQVLRYCRNVRPTWVKFNSKDTKESEWCSRF